MWRTHFGSVRPNASDPEGPVPAKSGRRLRLPALEFGVSPRHAEPLVTLQRAAMGAARAHVADVQVPVLSGGTDDAHADGLSASGSDALEGYPAAARIPALLKQVWVGWSRLGASDRMSLKGPRFARNGLPSRTVNRGRQAAARLLRSAAALPGDCRGRPCGKPLRASRKAGPSSTDGRAAPGRRSAVAENCYRRRERLQGRSRRRRSASGL